jgi:peptidyl-prolyl cis-trans isomerase B (cyclophilin B)
MPKKSAESANCRVLTERQCNMKKRSLKFLALGISAVMMMGTLGACGSSKSDSSTADGSSFVITLYPDEAPITCENFEKLVKDGFYDGLKFHRVVDGFMAQGGDPSGDGTGGSSETIKGEFSQNGVENNLSHTRGVVSMARSNDPDSASSQFFICYSDDDTFLDGQYAAFGKVTEGMDVVDSFLKVERSLGSDGAQSSPNQDIVMEKVKMIDDDSDGNPRVEITMNDFLNE